MDGVGCGSQMDGQGPLLFRQMDGIGHLHMVGCGSQVGIDTDG